MTTLRRIKQAKSLVTTPREFDERMTDLIREAAAGGVPLQEIHQSLAGFLLAGAPMLGLSDDDLFERMRDARKKRNEGMS